MSGHTPATVSSFGAPNSMRKKKITEHDLDLAAQWVIDSLNDLIDGNERRHYRNVYKKGYRNGYMKGIEHAAKELLAR